MPTPPPPVVQVTVIPLLVGYRIEVDHPTVYMNNQGLNPMITWNIVTPDWTFEPNGVAFADQSQTQFSNPQRSSDGITFTWYDANTDNLSYNYNITVVHDQFGQVVTHDPAIQNETN